jgi:hypothetical protein
MENWRIYSKAGVILDSPIPGIKDTSSGTVWSVEFDLPTMDVDLTRIAIKIDSSFIFKGLKPGMYIITSLRSAKKVGGATNPMYFHLGSGRTNIASCSPDVIELVGARVAVPELFVPVSIADTNGPSSTGFFVVKVAGLCGSNPGTPPPTLVVSPRNDPGAVLFSRSLGPGDSTVEVSLPPGDYDVVVKPTRLGSNDMDNFVMRDFLVVPTSSNVTAEGIRVPGAK